MKYVRLFEDSGKPISVLMVNAESLKIGMEIWKGGGWTKIMSCKKMLSQDYLIETAGKFQQLRSPDYKFIVKI